MPHCKGGDVKYFYGSRLTKMVIIDKMAYGLWRGAQST